MTPEDWQDYCNNLARLRHGPDNYQEVPDHDRGDLGIESFALDGTGCVYQFYCPEAVDTDGRYEAQRRKITTDLNKLKKEDVRLSKLLGFQIRRWILVVPNYDSKRIIEHASNRARVVSGWGLQCVDPSDFRVLVQDDDAFSAEREKLQSAGVATALVDATVEVKEVDDWAVSNAAEVEQLDEKLARLIAMRSEATKSRAELRGELLRYHLRGQNYAQQLQQKYPDLYERFAKAKANEEEDLRVRSLTTSSAPQEHLAEVRLQYENRLRSGVPGLSTDDAPMLAWAGVAEWMIRCPLDFPAEES
jgi:hypothetical protein